MRKTVFEKRYNVINGIGRVNRIDIEVIYQKGDDMDSRRGYFLSICPVHATGMMVTYEGWSGEKVFLKPVLRKTKKTEEKIIEKYNDLFEKFVLPFCQKEGYDIGI